MARLELNRLYDLWDQLQDEILEIDASSIPGDGQERILDRKIAEFNKWRKEIKPVLVRLHARCPDYFEEL